MADKQAMATAVEDYKQIRHLLHGLTAGFGIVAYVTGSIYAAAEQAGEATTRHRWARAAAIFCGLMAVILFLCNLRAITVVRSINSPYYEVKEEEGSSSSSSRKLKKLPAKQSTVQEIHAVVKAQRSAIAEAVAAAAAAPAGPAAVPSMPLHLPLTVQAMYAERLGNNVFQYMMARLRAAYLGVSFTAPALAAPFIGLPQQVPLAAHRPLLSPFLAKQLADAAGSGTAAALLPAFSSLPPAALSALLSSSHLHSWCRWLLAPASAYVMNSQLFLGHEQQIRAWLLPGIEGQLEKVTAKCSGALAEAEHEVQAAEGNAAAQAAAKDNLQSLQRKQPVLQWQPNDVAVHVRLGDIFHGVHAAYRPLPLSFYKQALQAVADRLQRGKGAGAGAASLPAPAVLGRIVLVTEDRQHRMARRMEACLRILGYSHIIIQACSLTEDFLTLYTAPNLILSISSFAWWAGYLGRAGTVVFPEFGMYIQHCWSPEGSKPEGWREEELLGEGKGSKGAEGGILAGLADIRKGRQASADELALQQMMSMGLHDLTIREGDWRLPSAEQCRATPGLQHYAELAAEAEREEQERESAAGKQERSQLQAAAVPVSASSVRKRRQSSTSGGNVGSAAVQRSAAAAAAPPSAAPTVEDGPASSLLRALVGQAARLHSWGAVAQAASAASPAFSKRHALHQKELAELQQSLLAKASGEEVEQGGKDAGASLGSTGGGSWDYSLALAESPRVVRFPLPDLQRWKGSTDWTVVTLFDLPELQGKIRWKEENE